MESELIGLVPKCAFAGTNPEYLKLKDFDKNRLLETHLKILVRLIFYFLFLLRFFFPGFGHYFDNFFIELFC